jgi:L-threonylcarbamoyladenylate synthase
VHISTAEHLPRWAADVPPVAARLADACWPGPLTVLLRRRPDVDATATGGRATIGLRVPAHPLALDLIDRFGGALAAPSANRFGRVSPTTADHVRADLGRQVDLVLDGGPCPVGIESTIVDCTTDPVTVLRPGGISVEDIERIVGGRVVRRAEGPSRAPGMLASHYAPHARVTLVPTHAAAEEAVASARARGDSADLLDPGPDLLAYARGLYGWLRDADERGLDELVVVEPDGRGLGLAVLDRLHKAAAPRPPRAYDDDT